jgi:hypothetical protein
VPTKTCKPTAKKKSITPKKKPATAKQSPRKTYKHLDLKRTRELWRRARRGEKTAVLSVEFGVHPTTVRAVRAGRTKRGL